MDTLRQDFFDVTALRMDSGRSYRFFLLISTDKRACVQQTITVYRLARNGVGGKSIEISSKRTSGPRRLKFVPGHNFRVGRHSLATALLIRFAQTLVSADST